MHEILGVIIIITVPLFFIILFNIIIHVGFGPSEHVFELEEVKEPQDDFITYD